MARDHQDQPSHPQQVRDAHYLEDGVDAEGNAPEGVTYDEQGQPTKE